MADQKPYISPSRLDMYCRCGEQFRRRYIEGEVLPPGIAAMKGTAIHGAARRNFNQKIETHRDLPAADIVELAVAEFEAATHGAYYLLPEEASRGRDVALGEAKDEAAGYAKAHAKYQAPEYQPVLVEARARIELPSSSHDLLGVVDLADDRRRVVDFKTGKRKSQAEVDASVQLTVYAAAHLALTGEPASEVRLDALTQLEHEVSRQVHVSQRGPADYGALAHRINAVLHGIQAGSFPPATPGAWWCDARYCGFHSSCKYVRKGTA